MGEPISSRACTAYISLSLRTTAHLSTSTSSTASTPFTVSSEKINPTRRARGNHVG
jgi:hypothetical protein